MILIAGQLISTLVTALGVIIVARFLASTNYGLINVAYIPISIAMLFSDIGISAALTRYLSQYRYENKKELIRVFIETGLLINCLLGITLTALVYSFSNVLAGLLGRPEIEIFIKIYSLSLIGQTLITVSQAIFVGFERMKLQSLTNIFYSVIKSLLGPTLVWLGYGPFGAVIGQTTPIIVTGLLSITFVLLIIMKSYREKFRVSRIESAKTMLNYGYPVFLANFLNGVLNQFYNSLLAIYVATDLFGNYNAALNFSVLVTFFATPIATALFPLFSKLKLENKNDLELVFQYSIKYATIATIPITTMLLALAGPIIHIVYSDTYEYAPLYMQLWILNYLFIALGSLSVGSLINSQGRTDVNFKSAVSVIVIGVPLGLYLIPKYGVVGLLITQLISSKPGFFYNIWWIKKHFHIGIDWRSSIKLLLISGIAYIITVTSVSLVHQRNIVLLIIGGAITAITFLILMPLAGVINEDDIENIAGILSPLKPLKLLISSLLAVEKKLIKLRYVFSSD
jgi:O-antigen/teichoic acid export membrane protein